MARKKRQRPCAETKSPEFAHNPFRELKGLSVSPPPDHEPPKPAASRPSPAPQREEVLFLEEMALLRVSRSKHRAVEESEDRPPEDECGDADPHQVSPDVTGEDEQSLFLRALGVMERTFVDEIPDEPRPPQASPRRMRELERGRLKPDAELDLHGFDRARARERVRHFLDNSRHQGLRTVLIITGAGLHSSEEPVLRGDLERFLAEEGRRWALEWGRAPRRLGGEGALVIFLRK
jgi:DNA-nicking Smr family endonuclease